MNNQQPRDSTEAHTGTTTDALEDDSVMNSDHAPRANTTLMEVRPRMDDTYSQDEQTPDLIVPKRSVELPPGSDGSAG